MGVQCQAVNSAGDACRAYAVDGGIYCFWHNPAKATERQAAVKRGGRHSRKNTHAGEPDAKAPTKVRTPQDVMDLLDYALASTVILPNSIARTRTLVSIAAAYINAMQVGAVEQRLAALEYLYGQSSGMYMGVLNE